jgi:hypothetical protein
MGFALVLAFDGDSKLKNLAGDVHSLESLRRRPCIDRLDIFELFRDF